MWKVAITLLLLSQTVFGATIFHCPEGALCHEQGAIESSSFKFLDKLGPKQYQTVTKLTVSNASLDKVPAELKYLKKLEYLDLSNNNIQISSIPSLPHLRVLKLRNNNIKGISLTLLPKNIEDLDLSNNLLSHIPKDWNFLRSLKTLHLYKNLIDCDCYSNNVLTYNKLIKEDIAIPEPVTCYLPKQFADKDITSINCSAEDEMINDQPLEGSGAGEDIFSEPTKATLTAPYLHEESYVEENEVIDDKDDLPAEKDNLMVTSDITTTVEPEEGSGDFEGSGLGPIEIVHIPACVFDCATPEPIGVHDGNDTAPQPGPKEQIKIVAEDVFRPIFADPTSSTTTTTIAPTTTTPTTTSSTTTQAPPPVVSEETIGKEVNIAVSKASDKDTDTEVFSNETRTGEMEKATALNQNNYAVYIVVACGLLLAVVFLVCLIKKRKTKRINRKRREKSRGFGEEMKSLEKPSIQPVNEKNGKTPNNLPEHIPLINDQNGKARDEPVLKSYTPLEHPESLLTNGNAPEENDFDEPELREKPELLTPTTERVTIRASEIPDSLPKTPVLVHRQKNSEGEIVDTVVPP